MKTLHIKQRLVTIVVFLVLAGVIGLGVMVSGIVPIKASSKHWLITKWILDFSKTRSVATHSMGIEPPPLDDASLVMKGAGHYETGCVPCHGSPARPASPIALSMTATPPELPPVIAEFEPEELFYIVKHGIKFTGMPAWPTQKRDDEVWAMIAFLRELPSMDAATYESLTTDKRSDASSPVEGLSPSVVETCHRCHGTDGQGRGDGAFPRLAGQKQAYLLASLNAYASGNRHSGIMQPIAAVLSEDERTKLAAHYAELPAVDGPTSEESRETADDQQAADDELVAAIDRGRTIAASGIPDQNVPSCIDCHGPGDQPRSEKYPHLAGQFPDYLKLQLELFKSNNRGGTDAAHLMHPTVRGLTQDDMHDVAAYYGSLESP